MQESTLERTGHLATNPLLKLEALGQSVWLDFLSRGMLANGGLHRLIEEDGLRGVTANPSIFEKAITGSHDYDRAIAGLAKAGKSPIEIYEALAIEDVQRAADLFRPVYKRTAGRDGFVSLEVSPRLAYDTAGTIAEARRFWAALDRPNVMIKVPATREGLPAIRQLTSEGINVNITLLFGLPRYRGVIEAYLAGLEARHAQGLPLESIQSVASFFLSRIDVLVDPMLERLVDGGGDRAKVATGVRGEIAVASAKMAYQIYQEIFEQGERFAGLARQGASVQRLLWASTGTKNPAYPDLKYVEPLIGPATVNTMPLETIDAYRDHGNPVPTITANVERARRALMQLAAAGIEIDQVTQQLEDEGVRKFDVALGGLLEAIQTQSTGQVAKAGSAGSKPEARRG